jgi:hypothetical protein
MEEEEEEEDAAADDDDMCPSATRPLAHLRPPFFCVRVDDG